jgi:hypothetical protein
MKISKDRALTLINQKIEQFGKVLNAATYENRYDEAYKLAYYGTETLLTELFSADEAMKFRRSVTTAFAVVGGRIDYEKELNDYKKHIHSCISQLKVYGERISNFWTADEPEQPKKTTTVPFVSMSFDENDKEINEYIIGILKALKIDFETGERYSKDSVPEKIQNRIRNSGLFVVVFVRRDKIEGGGYTTPSWLLKELGIAQGCKKEIIAWVERGIKDIANLNYEKEVIYFDRESTVEIEKATLKFLEALKEHDLT